MTIWHKLLFTSAFLAAFLAVGILRAHANPFTCTPTDCTFNAQYLEPSTNALGAPLTNLTSTTVNYQISVDGGTPGPIKPVVTPATGPSGGGSINKPITDTSLTPGHKYTLTGTAVATSPSGTSAPSAPFTPLTIDRAGEVPPGNPPAGGSFK